MTADGPSRILVTGGAGFIGSHLCDRLRATGHATVAVDDLSLGRRENLEQLAADPGFEFHRISVLEPAFDELVARGGFATVFHMAANSDIQAGSRDRRIDLERTFMTTWAVCESMARHRVGELLFASTSAVYGEVATPMAEDHGPLEPVSFYGAAKLAAEAYASAYAHRHDIRTWIFRFPNVVGARGTHGAVVDFIDKLRRDGKVLEVLGDGTQQKPYLHVDELLDAILLAWEHGNPKPLSVWNVGPESSTRVSAIAEMVVAEMGLAGSTQIRYGDEPRGWPGDVPRFTYDLERIYGLGWRARRSSDEAVRQAVRELVVERTGR